MIDQMVTERNWAGNYGYQAPRIAHPASMAELQDLVAGAGKVRALGSRHSFNDIADTAGTLVVLDRLDAGISVDPQNMTVTVSGGTRYGTLAAELHRQGFALHNLASLPHISVAGAVATATHGSGDGNGNLATAVAALELVTADGTVVTARRGDADFDGMVVGLGALGIVSRLTLDIEPSFEIAQSVFEGLDWEQVLESFDDVTSAAYSVSLFTDWSGPTVGQAWLKNRTDQTGLPAGLPEFFAGTPATQARHPLPGVSGSNCTQQLGVPGPWSDRLAHFRMEFTPSKGDELQSEYLIPREHAVDALRTMRSLSGASSPPCSWSGKSARSQPTSCGSAPTTAATESACTSPGARTSPPSPRSCLVLEAELAPFGARPHWGKLFHGGAAGLAPLYPRFADFTALAGRLDPAGKFRNAFLDRTVFGR